MSDTTDPGSRSAAEIEREVEHTRDKLRDTLEALRERASPGQLFEQVLDYAKESGGPEMMRNLGRTVRDNPMPLLLIGAGIGWMMMSGRGGGSRHWEADYGDDHDYGRRWSSDTSGTYRAGEMRDRDRTGRSFTDRAAETASGLRDSVTGAASSVVEGAREAAEHVGEMASDAYRRVSRAAGSVAGDARHYVERSPRYARRGYRWMLHEQPLLLGALGLALGAAAGALIPGTEYEDRLMGETREDMLRRARETAEEGYEHAKERASHLVSQVTEAGKESAGGLADTVRDAAQRARESVSEAARDLAEQAKSSLGEAGKAATPQTQAGLPHAPANEPGKPPHMAHRTPDPARPGGMG
ncbi:MAG TPA: DUF3618 domain-containing protein [Acetobacteraceae bacterium]|nr:DUF3618 domain-containing protein [Acetobacteraceae bacterium]